MYYEHLAQDGTINSTKCYKQLDRLKVNIEEKWPGIANRKEVIFHHDDERPYVSSQTRQKLRQFNWDVL